MKSTRGGVGGVENKAATARISANYKKRFTFSVPLAEMALVVADVAGGMKEAEAREAEATAERSWSARASRRRRDGTVRRWLRDRSGRWRSEPPAHRRRFGRGSGPFWRVAGRGT